MYKIYAISQGMREADLSRVLPYVVEPGTKGMIASYMWCIKGEDQAILVDTGMTDESSAKFHTAKYFGGTKYLEERLRAIGVDPGAVKTVIVSHLHDDHFSALELYPRATFWIQRKDIEYVTGPGAGYSQIARFLPHIPELMNMADANRIHYLEGDEEIAPGIKAILIGGHTPGSQVVVVQTDKGNAVICSDGIDLYRNLDERVVGMYAQLLPALQALDRIKQLASLPELIIPGHDVLVLSRFPNPIEGVAEIA